MTAVTVNKKLTVNLGNYESLALEASVTIPIRVTETEDGTVHENSIKEAYTIAWNAVDSTLYAEASEASELTEVRNSFILTWLYNRKDMPYANREN